MPAVEILERPSVTFTAIPSELKEHFAGQGKELVLIYAHAMNLSMNRAYGRYPLLYDELPPTLQRIARQSFDNPTKNDGELRRGDCVLVIQSVEERDAWRGDAEARLLAQESNDDIGDKIEEINQEIGQRGGRPMIATDTSRLPNVRDHVLGGKELAAKVAEQEAEQAAAKEKGRKL